MIKADFFFIPLQGIALYFYLSLNNSMLLMNILKNIFRIYLQGYIPLLRYKNGHNGICNMKNSFTVIMYTHVNDNVSEYYNEL